MKFGQLLEQHKIPEWYTQYCVYNEHKKRINAFKEMAKKGMTRKLKGYYTINNKGQIYCIDFIKNYKEDVAKKPAKLSVKKRTISSARKGSLVVTGTENDVRFASEIMVDKKRSETSVDSEICEESDLIQASPAFASPADRHVSI